MATEVGRTRAGLTTHLLPREALTDSGPIEALAAAIGRCVDDGEMQVTIDLSSVPLISSAGLEALLLGQEHLTRLGGLMRLVEPRVVVREVLRLTGVDRQIPVAANGEEGERPASASGGGRQRIGDILLGRGVVTAERIEQALERQKQGGGRMAQILVDEGWLEEAELLAALSEQLGVPYVQLRSGLYDPAVAGAVPAELCRSLSVLPLFQLRGVVHVAIADPQSLPALDAVADRTGCEATPVLATGRNIAETIEEAHSHGHRLAEFLGDLQGELELVEEQPEDAQAVDDLAAGNPVINLINGVILRAVDDGASDIHIEPTRSSCRIRLRVDGVLHPFMSPPLEVHPALVSRLKVMARLDIAERRLPQDGRIQIAIQGRTVDLRFSSLPGIFGEKIVLRVLDKNESILDIERLGMHEDNLAAYKALLDRSYGLILVTGPTGSGKTTTLYAALNHLCSDQKNIVTIEDPVEYQMDAINQNQVRENIGLGFAKVLRAVLRQDPDIIMVGEIRERETAEIAVQAALTGHLVLSTLHTNDSIGAITRMLDMGVEPFLLSSGLIGVVAQRLVRGICPHCRTQSRAPADALASLGVENRESLMLSRGRGCSRCYDSGYKNRFPLHEVLVSDPEMQRLTVSNPSRDELDAFIRARGLARLADDGARRVIEGKTTLEEVLRAVNN